MLSFLAEKLSMGQYTSYVWSSYAIALGLLVWCLLHLKQLKRRTKASILFTIQQNESKQREIS